MHATFMAKPYEEHAGSGMHIHISMLNNKGKTCWWTAMGRLCAAQTRAGRDDRSDAGLDGAAGAERELVSPLPAGDVRPDAGFVGHNNRTVALRIPCGERQNHRVEYRVAGRMPTRIW